MVFKDYYKILGVKPGSTRSEIRGAYRKKASSSHPDKNPGNEGADKFIEAKEAYDTLSDPHKREEYDREYRGQTDGEHLHRQGPEMASGDYIYHGSFLGEFNELLRRFFGTGRSPIADAPPEEMQDNRGHIHYDDLLKGNGH